MLHGSTLNFKYKTKDLISKLEENRKKHKDTYEVATIQYKKELEDELAAMLKKAKAGISISHLVNLEKPEEYLKEYDTALDILKMTSQKEVDIDQRTFAQLVRDEWDWKTSFLSKTVGYAAKIS